MHITNKESSQFLFSNDFDLARNNLDYVSAPDRYIATCPVAFSPQQTDLFAKINISRLLRVTERCEIQDDNHDEYRISNT